jgi:hypothetical protein
MALLACRIIYTAALSAALVTTASHNATSLLDAAEHTLTTASDSSLVTPTTVNVSNPASLDVALQNSIDTLLASRDFSSPSGVHGVDWWFGANAWAAITISDRLNGATSHRATMEEVREHVVNVSSPTFEYTDYNDDQAWWALWACEAHDAYEGGSSSSIWLQAAAGAWDTISATWNTECGGGVVWQRSEPAGNGKLAIPNALLMLLSARLWEFTSNAKYRSMFERLWAWFQVSGLLRDDGLVADGTHREQPVYDPATCHDNINWATYSYNTGVLMGALARMGSVRARAAPHRLLQQCPCLQHAGAW